jgi:hypothetical protein
MVDRGGLLPELSGFDPVNHYPMPTKSELTVI